MGIIIIGARGHGRVVLDLIQCARIGPVVGLLDDDPSLNGAVLGGIPVLGSLSRLPALLGEHRVDQAVVAIGDNAVRRRIAEHLLDLGLKLPPLVHPHAIVARSARLGDGTVVMAGAVVGVQTTIGLCGIINTRASVDHDCTLADYVHVAPGAILTGHVTVADGVLIGAGATIIPQISIGRQAIVGAGATVIRDVPPGTTVVGCPAHPLNTP